MVAKANAVEAKRWKVYTGARGRDFLCIVEAVSESEAIRTAKSLFDLTRSAYARLETPSEALAAARALSMSAFTVKARN